jgi:hypothetical protein
MNQAVYDSLLDTSEEGGAGFNTQMGIAMSISSAEDESRRRYSSQSFGTDTPPMREVSVEPSMTPSKLDCTPAVKRKKVGHQTLQYLVSNVQCPTYS